MCSGRWISASTSCMHSTTKYLNGHSDVVGGVAVVAEDGADPRQRWPVSAERRRRRSPGRSTAFLCCAPSKTLPVRMERASATVRSAVAAFLEAHPEGGDACYYPGLREPPAARYRPAADDRRFGGIVTAVLKGGLERGQNVPRAHASCSRWPKVPGRRREPDRASGDHDPC
ncbi:MAG: PLP-dependent transferase [Thalassobaculum sp.]